MAEPATTSPSQAKMIGGRFRVLSTLGNGSFGTVYLCQHKHTQELLAVKVLNPAVAIHSGARRLLIREATASKRLMSPNIVRVYDVDVPDDGTSDDCWIAMEFVPGESLQERMARKPLTHRKES